MKYIDFENLISKPRLNRYLIACAYDTRKTMTLYRLNLRLSQQMFTIISCFEIVLRNKINYSCTAQFGNDWLKRGIIHNDIFGNRNRFRITQDTIQDAINKLDVDYSHNKLVAELGFGFWRYMFARHHYRATGRILLS